MRSPGEIRADLAVLLGRKPGANKKKGQRGNWDPFMDLPAGTTEAQLNTFRDGYNSWPEWRKWALPALKAMLEKTGTRVTGQDDILNQFGTPRGSGTNQNDNRQHSKREVDVKVCLCPFPVDGATGATGS